MNPRITQQIFIVFVLLFVSCDKLEKLCQEVGPTMVFWSTKQEINYNASSNYNKGVKIGKGSYGEVRQCVWPKDLQKSAAIKRVEYGTQLHAELETMKKLEGLNIAPSFYGCQWAKEMVPNDPKNPSLGKRRTTIVYIVQELMLGDLDSRAALDILHDAPHSIKLKYWLNVVTGFIELNLMGFVHADIKPGNLMMNIDESQLLMIDFGLVQKIKGPHVIAGSPWFMSRTRHTEPLWGPKNLPRDDLYALALTVAIVESSYDEVFKELKFSCIDKLGKPSTCYKALPNSCFLGDLNDKCAEKVFDNAREVFEAAGFGKYLENKRDPFEWNFTTLLLHIINQKIPYNIPMEETHKIMQNIIFNYEFFEKKINNGLPVSKKVILSDSDLVSFGNLYALYKKEAEEIEENTPKFKRNFSEIHSGSQIKSHSPFIRHSTKISEFSTKKLGDELNVLNDPTKFNKGEKGAIFIQDFSEEIPTGNRQISKKPEVTDRNGPVKIDNSKIENAQKLIDMLASPKEQGKTPRKFRVINITRNGDNIGGGYGNKDISRPSRGSYLEKFRKMKNDDRKVELNVKNKEARDKLKRLQNKALEEMKKVSLEIIGEEPLENESRHAEIKKLLEDEYEKLQKEYILESQLLKENEDMNQPIGLEALEASRMMEQQIDEKEFDNRGDIALENENFKQRNPSTVRKTHKKNPIYAEADGHNIFNITPNKQIPKNSNINGYIERLKNQGSVFSPTAQKLGFNNLGNFKAQKDDNHLVLPALGKNLGQTPQKGQKVAEEALLLKEREPLPFLDQLPKRLSQLNNQTPNSIKKRITTERNSILAPLNNDRIEPALKYPANQHEPFKREQSKYADRFAKPNRASVEQMIQLMTPGKNNLGHKKGQLLV